MNSVMESTQETKPTVVVGGAGNVVTRGHRRSVGTVTMLLGMVMVLVLVIAACGGGEVNESKSGMVNGKISKSELGTGESASATFNLAPGKYVLFCNLWGHYKDGMYSAFEVIDDAGSQGATVNVQLGEWYVYADNASVTAGPITFEVSNKGGQSHQFIIIQTDLAPDALSVKKWG